MNQKLLGILHQLPDPLSVLGIENKQSNSKQQTMEQQCTYGDSHLLEFIRSMNKYLPAIHLNKIVRMIKNRIQMYQSNNVKETSIIMNQDKDQSNTGIIVTQRKPKTLNSLNQLNLSSQYKLSQDIQQYITMLITNNQIKNPTSYQVPSIIDVDNPELLFYVLREQLRQEGKQLLSSKQPNKLNIIGLHRLLTDQAEDSQAYCITLQETESLTFELLQSDINARQQFETMFIKALSQDLKINQEQIIICSIEKGSIKIIYQIIDDKGQIIQESTDLEQLNKQFPNSKPTLQLHQLFKQAALNINDFEPKYNKEWRQGYTYRGPDNKFTYYYPYGWKGYALKVQGIYGQQGNDKNDNWLAKNQIAQEWQVLFHGTSFGALNPIIKDREQVGLKEGSRQAYSNDKCMKTGFVIGKGVYLSNHIEVCAKSYASHVKVNTKNYQVVIQSRVNPIAVRQCEKRGDIQVKVNQADWENDYFVVNKSCDIRIYRILLKKD